MARVSGRIVELLVSEGDIVRKGDLLSVMESTSNYNSIRWLATILDTVEVENIRLSTPSILNEPFPENVNLGELQEYYTKFRKSTLDFSNHISIDLYGRRMEVLADEIKNIDRYISGLESSEKLFEQRLQLEYNKYKRDSILFLGEAKSVSELEQTKQNYLELGIELEQIRLDKVTKSIDKSSKLQAMQELEARGEEEREKLRSIRDAEYLNLVAKIEWWFQNYLIQSPIDGRVTFNKFWGENQIVKEGETIMTVVPEGENRIIARVVLSVKGSGKVQPGQKVNIRLTGYPYMEYGMVEGIVKSKSLITTDNSYLLDVELPNRLTTFYGKELEFTQSMPGTAEVITEDQRLIERIAYPFKFMYEKNFR
jgi:HlyD family secretion protein